MTTATAPPPSSAPPAPAPPPAPAAAAPPRRTSSASGEWGPPRTSSASGEWDAPAPPPNYGVAPDATAPKRRTSGASGAWDFAASVTAPSPEYARARARERRPDELPPVPRTDETLPLWQQVYDEMRPEFEQGRESWTYKGWDTGRHAKDVNPEALRERAWMAQVEREFRRRYWTTR